MSAPTRWRSGRRSRLEPRRWPCPRSAHEAEQHRHRRRLAGAVRADEAGHDTGSGSRCQWRRPRGGCRSAYSGPPCEGGRTSIALGDIAELPHSSSHTISIAEFNLVAARCSSYHWPHAHRTRPSRAEEAADPPGDRRSGEASSSSSAASIRSASPRSREPPTSPSRRSSTTSRRRKTSCSSAWTLEQELLTAVRERPEGETPLRAFACFILERSDSAMAGEGARGSPNSPDS